jgi:hypothetical protein
MPIVTRKEDSDEDRRAWIAAARHALARVFGEEEPAYTLDDVKEGDVDLASGPRAE